jgi:hypothetical protein
VPHREGAAEVVRVAIYKDDIPASGAAASPDYLARLLEAPAFTTAFLNGAQLADARSLAREQFDVLVLPYGASFPVRAADNFRKFLRDGGKFFSTGGYAFDNLLERTADGSRPLRRLRRRAGTLFGITKSPQRSCAAKGG